MSKALGDISFIDLLPLSISGDSTIAAAAAALDGELKAAGDAIVNIYLYSRIDELEEAQLKHLAWQWHVDFWDDTLTMEKKRILVKQSFPWHRKKGTPNAVEQMVADVLGGGYVQEWFEYGGVPYHFRIQSNSPPGDAETYNRLMAAVAVSKNERSVLDAIVNSPAIDSTVHVVGAVAVGTTITIEDEGVFNV